MSIMRLPTVTLTKNLVTIPIAVLLPPVCGCFLRRVKALNTDTLVATATYVALLVVSLARAPG